MAQRGSCPYVFRASRLNAARDTVWCLERRDGAGSATTACDRLCFEVVLLSRRTVLLLRGWEGGYGNMTVF